MPVLPYCILLHDSAPAIPEKGLLGSDIHRFSGSGLLVPYSKVVKDSISATTFRSAALEFHRVVSSIFEHAGVVPFRFPTWLTSAELSKHLQQQSPRYRTFLSDHAHHVQMELRLTAQASSPGDAKTGTEHLLARAADFRKLHDKVESLKNILSPEVIEWRERETAHGLRIYGLVDRTNVARFRERLSKRELDAVRWSGPWPATEFL